MFNKGIDRGSNVPKIMGVLCALAAVLDVAGIFFGGGFSCIIYAVANGLLAFICHPKAFIFRYACSRQYR